MTLARAMAGRVGGTAASVLGAHTMRANPRFSQRRQGAAPCRLVAGMRLLLGAPRVGRITQRGQRQGRPPRTERRRCPLHCRESA